MGQYIEEGKIEEKNQEQEMDEIIERLKQKVSNDLKIVFFSSIDSNARNHYVTYRFPIEMYNEDMFKSIEGYARQDMITRSRLGEKVTDITRLLFFDRDNNDLGETYNLKHDQEFLDKLQEMNAKTL